MATLILYDQMSKAEVARGPMQEGDRYQLYLDCRDHRLFTMAGKQYTVHKVEWNPATAECACVVTFAGWEPCSGC